MQPHFISSSASAANDLTARDSTARRACGGQPPGRVSSRFRLHPAWLPMLLVAGVSAARPAPVRAGSQPGAPRVLRLAWDDSSGRGAAAPAEVSQPVFGSGAEGEQSALFFTRTFGGTRNLWRVLLPALAARERDANHDSRTDAGKRDATTSGTSVSGAAISASLGARGKALRAVPLTHLQAPFFAADAVPLPGGRALLCVTNAAGAGDRTAVSATDTAREAASSRIARLELDGSERLTPLTAGNARSYSPALSPDGSRFAFVSNRAGVESVFIMALDGGGLRRVALMARRPCWLDAATLVYESTRPDQPGLFRLALPPGSLAERNAPRASLLFARGGQSAAAPGARLLCVAAASNSWAARRPAARESGQSTESDASGGASDDKAGLDPDSRLYLLAADGSGARAVASTDGARNPNFAPDGSALIYDAPDFPDGGGQTTGANPLSTPRALWLLPMVRVLPTALLRDVRPVRGAVANVRGAAQTAPGNEENAAQELEIVGTAFANGDAAPQVRLEWGEGDEPARWNPLRLLRVPAHDTVLGTWRVPPNLRGDYVLRLTVVDADGDPAESRLPLTLPLAPAVTDRPPLLAQAPPEIPQPLPSTATPPIAPPRRTPMTLPPGAVATPATRFPAAPRPATTTPPTTSPAFPLPAARLPATGQNLTGPTRTGGSSMPPPSRRNSVTRPSSERTVQVPPASIPPAAVIPPPSRTEAMAIASAQAAAETIAGLPPPAPTEPPVRTAPRDATPRRVMPRDAARSLAGIEARPPLTPPLIPPVAGMETGPLPPRTRIETRRVQKPRAAMPHAGTPHAGTPHAAGRTSAPRQIGSRKPAPPARLAAAPGRSAGSSATRPDVTFSSQGRDFRARRAMRRGRDAASISVSGVPPTVPHGDNLIVVFLLRKTAPSAWSPESPQPVRLRARGQDAATGQRTRYEIQWLPAEVRPGGGTRLTFSLTAPPRPGRYTLRHGLVRLASGARYQPPFGDAGSRSSRGESRREAGRAASAIEFGTTSLSVRVR